MTGQSQIKEHMPVFCADGQPHGQVDRVNGDYIKLTKDDSGEHHWLPLWTIWISTFISTSATPKFISSG